MIRVPEHLHGHHLAAVDPPLLDLFEALPGMKSCEAGLGGPISNLPATRGNGGNCADLITSTPFALHAA